MVIRLRPISIMVYNIKMKYVKATVIYLFSHFPRLIVLSVLPAAVVSIFMNPQGFGLFLPVNALSEVESFSDVFFLVFDRNLIMKWPYMILVGLLLLALCISYTMGIVEKHFRVGKLSLRQPFTNINNCFITVFKTFGLLVVIYIVYRILLVCLLTLLVFVLGSFSVAAVWTSVVIAVISTVGFIFLLVLVRPIMFTAATMLVYGYSFKDAFSVALKLGETEGRTALDIGLILPFAVYLTVSALLAVFGAPYIALAVVHTVLIAILLQYVTVYVLVAMFSLSGIERRDVRRYY